MQPYFVVLLFFGVCLLHGLFRAFYDTGFDDSVFPIPDLRYEQILAPIGFEIEKLCYETIIDKHPYIPQTELKNAASTFIYLSLFEMVKSRIKIETIRDEFIFCDKLRGTLFLGVERSEF